MYLPLNTGDMWLYVVTLWPNGARRGHVTSIDQTCSMSSAARLALERKHGDRKSPIGSSGFVCVCVCVCECVHVIVWKSGNGAGHTYIPAVMRGRLLHAVERWFWMIVACNLFAICVTLTHNILPLFVKHGSIQFVDCEQWLYKHYAVTITLKERVVLEAKAVVQS